MADKVYLDKEGLTHLLDKLKDSVTSGSSVTLEEVQAWVQDTAKAHAAGTADSAAKATTADTATKLGADDVGNESTPIYLLKGVPTPVTSLPASFSGTSSQIILGDGTVQDISTFLKNNIETIRTALGVVTTDKIGLVPTLPTE